MSSEAQNVIANALREHGYNGASCGAEYPRHEFCTCGWSGPGEGVHEQHQAEEIDKALGGLTRRWGVVIEHPPRPADGYPGAVVELDSYKLREAAEITKRDQWPDDCYEVRSRWVSGWSDA
ncbi:hypothetical protein SEA_MADMEN_89 [Mycobacterium phage MadMen]|nr:hypothetical protein SEA_MADMEN_89 [Mycobacterium phage MadMen]